jgi:ribosomal protein S18 acetylase RimI-like enzyme
VPRNVRRAAVGDAAALAAIDEATWSSLMTPAPALPPGRAFFAETAPDDVLVAEADGLVVGYVHLSNPTPLEANRHVLEIRGLAVTPRCQRTGVGRALLDAAVDEARRRGCRKLRLRVLVTNVAARALYDAAGFVVEGVLREEFRIDGAFVDDVLMARRFTEDSSPE